MWVDVICINQSDKTEKEHQIPLMAEIYAKASQVLVWLGESEDNGDLVLKAISHAGGRQDDSLLRTEFAEREESNILKLLQRSWFQRIWVGKQTALKRSYLLRVDQVLQEVAAARRISIMCGAVEVDGHAFCLGLDSLDLFLEEPTTQVAFLIRGAIFRSMEFIRDGDNLSLHICSLGELLDMYHGYKATNCTIRSTPFSVCALMILQPQAWNQIMISGGQNLCGVSSARFSALGSALILQS